MNRPEIWHSARLIMIRQGEQAAEHARRRLATLASAGGQDGAVAVWTDILAMITYVRDLEPPPGATRH